jgi:hypothetical protein
VVTKGHRRSTSPAGYGSKHTRWPSRQVARKGTVRHMVWRLSSRHRAGHSLANTLDIFPLMLFEATASIASVKVILLTLAARDVT